MPDVAELIDQGIKAYVSGRVGEALRSFQQVLELDPGNPRARSYLLLIHGGAAGLIPEPAPAAAPVSGAPVPLPGGAVPLPGGAGVPPAPAAAAPGAVPLPGPAGESDQHPEATALDQFAPSPWDDGPAAVATFVLEPDGGLDLQAVADKSDLRPLVPDGAPPVAVRPPKKEVDVWMQAAKELFALGDFTGSLELIEKILQIDPNHGSARDYLRQNEATLIAMYESKLGPLVGVPRLAIKPEEVMWLNLDHRAGFLLAQIDGSVDYEALFALSGLPRLDTARILANLIADGVITS
jgi:tetratricopeptide (TPR) repeat protein